MKADLLIKNGLVLTLDAQDSVFEDGALAIVGDNIAAVGSTEDLQKRYTAKETLEARGCLVMPGLVNAHTHMAMALYRGLAEDIVLETWLEKLWKVENVFITLENVHLGAQQAILEMVHSGITTALDMYWLPEAGAKAAVEAGFRLATGPVVFDLPAADHLDHERRTALGIEFLEQYKNHPLIISCVQPHGTYTVSPEHLVKARELADRYGGLFHTHANETRAEVASIMQRYSCSPIEHLDKLGLLGEKTILAHCVHLSQGEMERLAQTRTGVSHNPLSNQKLASGIAPVREMLDRGVKVSLGTDGACSGNDLDMFKVMRTAALSQKIASNDPTSLPAKQVVHMAATGGAEALGIQDMVGSLEPGKRADIILIDLDQPHLIPLYDIYAQLVYAAGRGDVRTVLINGKIVMEDGCFQTIDEEAVVAKVKALASSIAVQAGAKLWRR